MLLLLTYYAACSHYSLQPPFNLTNESLPEIGNWTLRDSAINMKKFIRLTPSYQFTSGGLCERVPMYSSSWSFEANLSTGTQYGGVGFSFFYSSTLCANNIFNFNGLAAWINTTSTTDDYKFYFHSYKILKTIDVYFNCRRNGNKDFKMLSTKDICHFLSCGIVYNSMTKSLINISTTNILEGISVLLLNFITQPFHLD